MSFKIEYSLDKIDKFIPKILDNIHSNIILLLGEMGSGKTTLVKHLVKNLGGIDEVSSPTFALVNEYQTPDKKIYHFDLYRLKDETEALDFGIEEYFADENALIFIEWPQIIETYIPENSQKIRIIVKNSDTRILEIL